MHITPVIPDEYNGPVKRFICRHCQHISYMTLADYEKMGNVLSCHECSVQLAMEYEGTKKSRKYQSHEHNSPWKPTSTAQDKQAYRDVFHAGYPHECSDHCQDYAILLLNNKLTPVLAQEKVHKGEKYPHITRFHILEDYTGTTMEDAIAFVNPKVANRPKGLTAFEYGRICELLGRFSQRTQAIEAHFEEVAKERLLARNEGVTGETLAQEVKRVEIEETPLAMAIIAMMQERSAWQGTSDQLKRALRPYLQEPPMLFTNVLQHAAMLLPVQGISITLDEKKPDITISKV